MERRTRQPVHDNGPHSRRAAGPGPRFTAGAELLFAAKAWQSHSRWNDFSDGHAPTCEDITVWLPS